MKKTRKEVILEKRQLVALFTGGIIALILVFILGVLFGRNLASRKMVAEQAKIAKKAYFPEKQTPKPSPEKQQKQESAKEILKKIEEQKPPKQLVQAKKEEKVGAESEAKKESEEIKKIIEKSEGTEEKPKETKQQETKTEQPKEPAYTIQVASFPEKESAQKLLGELKNKKWNAFMESAEIPGKGTYWRVYVGKYSTKEQAQKALIIFKAREQKFKDAFIKRRF